MSKNTIDTPFMDVCEAANYLKIKTSTLYLWSTKKSMGIPKRKHGRRIVFDRTELKQWSDRRNAR